MARQDFPVGIVAKATQPRAIELSLKLARWLSDRGVDCRVDRETALAKGMPNLPDAQLVDRNRLTAFCDPIVVLGGDGTLISVSRHAVKSCPRILGVNVGTLGFLTEVTVDELFPVLESVLNGTARLETRRLLSAEVIRNGALCAQYSAINDVVVGKEAIARIFGIELLIDGSLAAALRGDGVIVSTPGGSTAYSLAAGGSIVHPSVEALLVTPICPHSLTSRPLVVPGSSEVTLRVSPHQRSREGEVYLTIDGQEGMALESNDVIRVKTSDSSVRFVKSPSRNYFDVLGAKLKWAKD